MSPGTAFERYKDIIELDIRGFNYDYLKVKERRDVKELSLDRKEIRVMKIPSEEPKDLM